MKQRNATTGFERLILHEEVLFGSPASPSLSPPPAIGQGAKVSSVWQIALAKQGLQSWRSRARDAVAATPTAPVELASVSTVAARPAEIATDDALLMRVGQLLQVSKQRPDGWAFGSVVYDEIDRPPLGVDGLSTQAGWFPVAHTAIATPDQLAKLQEKMGGSSADALAVPSTWTALKDPMVAELVPLGRADDAERAKAVDFFQQALHGRLPGVRIVAVERVQNVSMWQSFAVKRQTIVAREVKAADNHVLTEAEALDAVERVCGSSTAPTRTRTQRSCSRASTEPFAARMPPCTARECTSRATPRTRRSRPTHVPPRRGCSTSSYVRADPTPHPPRTRASTARVVTHDTKPAAVAI